MKHNKNKKVMKLGRKTTKVVLLLVAVGGMMTFNKINYNRHNAILEEKEAKIESLNKTLENSNRKLKALEDENSKLSDTVDDLISTTNSLNDQLKEAVSANKEANKALEAYKEREELYNKYEYVIYDTEGKRTDITYDEIQYAEDLVASKGYSPDLLFGIVMVESEGNRTAENTYSGARGYGQVMAETGKYVYENMLKEGIYYHDYAYNGKTNIRIVATYLEYLIKNKSSMFGVIKQYSGRSDSHTYAYMNRVNKALKGYNTIENISESLNK